MNKKLVFTIIGLAIAVVVVLVIVLSLQVRKNQNAVQQPPATLTIQTKNGDVVMNNFTAHPASVSGSAQYNDITYVIEQTKDYSIITYTRDASFFITLNSNPLSQSRSLAEAAFLKDLNISRTDACKLNVTLSVPISVNSQFSGKNYGLSFCLNGKQF